MRAPALGWALLVACVCAAASEGAAPPATAPKLTPGGDGTAREAKAAPRIEQWQFRWDKTSPIQGPYPTAQMVKYAKQGYFAQSNEPALVHLVGEKEDSWLPYDTIDFVAYADFMSQAALRAAGKPETTLRDALAPPFPPPSQQAADLAPLRTCRSGEASQCLGGAHG